MMLKNKYYVNLLSFNLFGRNGKPTYYLRLNETALEELTCKFAAFLDENFQAKLKSNHGFFYLSAFSTKNQPLIFEQIDFDLAQLPESNLVEVTFKLNIPTHLDNSAFPDKKLITYPKKKVRLRLSFSTQNVGDSYFQQDLEEGTFFNTIIPIEKADFNG